MEDYSTIIELINIFAAVIAIVLGVVSLWLSVRFFFASKKAESATAKTLTEIDQNVGTLKTINDGLLKTLVDHVTSSNKEMLSKLRYAENIRATVQPAIATETPHNRDETTRTQESSAPLTEQAIRDRILSEIRHLTETKGDATAIQLTNNLQYDFSFQAIMAMMLRMQQEGILVWDGEPQPPAAETKIRVVQAEPANPARG